MYFFNHNLSYGPGFLGWMSNNYLNNSKYLNMLKKLNLKEYKNLKVKKMDFKESLKKHKNDFLYLDPPYYLKSDSTLFKGIYPMRNIPVHHVNFEHIELFKLLREHKGGFIMSYNNCDYIRELYKKFKIINLEWQYTMGQGETRLGKNRIINKSNHIKNQVKY